MQVMTEDKVFILPTVVWKFNYVIIIGMMLCCHYHLEQCLRIFYTINDKLTSEKPVATMLAEKKMFAFSHVRDLQYNSSKHLLWVMAWGDW